MARTPREPVSDLPTSVRLSLQFSFLYAVLSVLVFAMAYWFTQYEVRDWVLDQMRGDAQTLRAIHDRGGAGKLIDKVDALAEGISDTGALILDSAGNEQGGPIAEYAVLWEQINGPGSWDANPWVWVIEFRRLP